jgi:hypothetical protein
MRRTRIPLLVSLFFTVAIELANGGDETPTELQQSLINKQKSDEEKDAIYAEKVSLIESKLIDIHFNAFQHLKGSGVKFDNTDRYKSDIERSVAPLLALVVRSESNNEFVVFDTFGKWSSMAIHGVNHLISYRAFVDNDTQSIRSITQKCTVDIAFNEADRKTYGCNDYLSGKYDKQIYNDILTDVNLVLKRAFSEK